MTSAGRIHRGRAQPGSGAGRRTSSPPSALSRLTLSARQAVFASQPTRRSARSCARSTRRLADGLRRRVDRRSRAAPLAGRFPPRSSHPPDGVLQPARLVRRLARRAAQAGVEIHEHTRVESVDELARGHRRRRDRRLPERPPRRARRSHRADARSGDRDRAGRGACCSRSPHYGRHGFDYWHQRHDGRIVAGGFRDVSLDTRVHR